MLLAIGFLLHIRQFYFYWSIEKSTNGIDGFWKIRSQNLPMEKGIKVCFIFYIHHYTITIACSPVHVSRFYIICSGPITMRWGTRTPGPNAQTELGIASYFYFEGLFINQNKF